MGPKEHAIQEEPLPGELEAIEEGEREFADGKTHRLDDILRRVAPVEPLAPEEEIMDGVVQEIRALRRSRRTQRGPQSARK